MSKKKKQLQTNTNIRPRPSGRGLKHIEDGRLRRAAEIWKRHKRIIIPGLIFLGLVAVFFVLYYSLVESRVFEAFMAFTARVTGFMLNLTGRGVTVDDRLVFSEQFAFQIVDLCTAIMPMMIFAAAVIAYPSRIKEKLIGLLIGIAGIFLVNQIRLVSLFYIGIYAPGIFETAHLLVWQSLMILLAIALWLIWAYKYVRNSAF